MGEVEPADIDARLIPVDQPDSAIIDEDVARSNVAVDGAERTLVHGPSGTAHQFAGILRHRGQVDIATSGSGLQVTTAREPGPLLPSRCQLLHGLKRGDDACPIIQIVGRPTAKPLLHHDTLDVGAAVIGRDNAGNADPVASEVLLQVQPQSIAAVLRVDTRTTNSTPRRRARTTALRAPPATAGAPRDQTRPPPADSPRRSPMTAATGSRPEAAR